MPRCRPQQGQTHNDYLSDHRAKNALAVVQAVVRLSRAENPANLAQVVEGRVAAMARAHTLLAASRWSGAELAAMVTQELEAYGGRGRVTVGGPPVAIMPAAAQSMAMALHELATNAAKHGALSSPQGRVEVSWAADAAEAGWLRLCWREHEGPPVAPPARSGFGSLLLEQTIQGQLRGELRRDWDPAGLRCRIGLPGDCFAVTGVSEPPAEPVHAAGKLASLAAGALVLVVEDEALTALALEQVLRDAGYKVLGPAARVQEALDLIRATPPEAAVLDVNLFGQPVLPVAEALSRMGVPFLFCTGYTTIDGLSERLRQAPVLAKPVAPEHLIEMIGRLLGSAGAPAAGMASA